MDFTLTTYRQLLSSLILKPYTLISFKDFIVSKSKFYKEPLVIIRHDVERIPQNALNIAEIEYSMGIRTSYYFRIDNNSFAPTIINKIAQLGHEIGYHYDDIETAFWAIKRKYLRQKIEEVQLINVAYESFTKNLEKMRRIADIKTICMHGSPLSKYDNRLIWQKYSYRDLGIIGEPYYDIDWEDTAYFTDTGRRWNGDRVSVRDKVNSKYVFNFKTTQELIANINKLPEKILINTHTHRWFNPGIMWGREFVCQNLKNIIKYIIVRSK